MPRWWSTTASVIRHYVTLKGVLKVISKVHVFIGIVFWFFLVWLDTMIIKKAPHGDMIAAVMGIQYFIYLFLFLPIGVMLHRGVKKESVPMLQWSGMCFLALQIYGGIIQALYKLLISDFLFEVFTSLKIELELRFEIGLEIGVSIPYVILVGFYIRQLRSHFYVPPVYPCRVEYYYYPEDTSTSVTVFHKQVPVTIMQNYQNYAYFVQKEITDSPPTTSSTSVVNAGASSSGRRRTGSGGSSAKGHHHMLANGRLPSNLWKCRP